MIPKIDEPSICKHPLQSWFLACRPKTLVIGIGPVVIGTSIAYQMAPLSAWVFVCSLLYALLIQIGANFSNDYFDFMNGADNKERKGFARAVQSGWISPKAMRTAFCLVFLAAFLVALPLLARIGWGYSLLVLFSIACAILYTGGPRPLGYLGLGEALVLLFYGPVSILFTVYAQTLSMPPIAWIASLAPGCLACAPLCVNNLRDEKTDRKAGKMTLIARFGRRFGELEFLACIAPAILIPIFLYLQGLSIAFLAVAPLTLWLSLSPIHLIFSFEKPEELNPAFVMTARLFALYTILFSTAFFL